MHISKFGNISPQIRGGSLATDIVETWKDVGGIFSQFYANDINIFGLFSGAFLGTKVYGEQCI